MSLRDSFKKTAQSGNVSTLAVPTPELPEIDGQVHVRRLAPKTLADIYDHCAKNEGENEAIHLISYAASDKDGHPIFLPEDCLWLEQAAELTPLVERLYAAARHHNGLTAANRESWRKNSPGTAAAGSPSC